MMTFFSSLLRSQKGFWATEMVGSVVMLGVVSHATYTLVANGSKTFSRETLTARLQTELAAAETVFLEDAHGAGYSPDGMAASLGTFQEVKTGTFADKVEFIADIDSDGVSDLVVYQLSGGKLERAIHPWGPSGWEIGSTEVLATNVDSFTLMFLDGDRSPLTSAQVLDGGTETARHLRLSMTVSTTTKSGLVSKTMAGEITFRN